MAYVQETKVHDMRPHRSPQADRPVGQYALLKGPHIASGDSCPVCRAAIVRATLRRGHSYTKILRDRGELNRRDTLTQW